MATDEEEISVFSQFREYTEQCRFIIRSELLREALCDIFDVAGQDICCSLIGETLQVITCQSLCKLFEYMCKANLFISLPQRTPAINLALKFQKHAMTLLCYLKIAWIASHIDIIFHLFNLE